MTPRCCPPAPVGLGWEGTKHPAWFLRAAVALGSARGGRNESDGSEACKADAFRVCVRLTRRDRAALAADMVAQALELSRKPHVVIATPGRLADHLRSSNTFSLKKLKFLVRLFPRLLPPL